jgi:hypothetical protein
VSQPDSPPGAVAAAVRLAGAVEALGGKVEGLAAYGKKNRHLIWGLVVSLVVDLALTVVVAVFAVQAHDANTSAQAARAVAAVAQANNRNLCLSGNASRAQQHGLWLYLFQLAGPPKTAQGAKLTGQFKAHLDVVFAPRDCAHVNPGKP